MKKRIYILMALGMALVSCSKQGGETTTQTTVPPPATAETNRQVYTVKGTVKEIKPAEKTAVIHHEKIPNYMEEMTMPFRVKDTNLLWGLTAGDSVRFDLVVTEDSGWIERLEKIGGTAPGALPSVESFRRVREVEPLAVGDMFPNYRFTNEFGRAIEWKDFSGRALVLTFIFTRCPFPEFCPRMSNNFADAYKQLTQTPGGPTNWHFFTLTFDPAFDTPAVLKQYAQRYKYDPQRWSFLTGALIDIDAITEQFGLWFSRGQGINWDHNLRTVVVDRQGQIQQIFIGNTWTADQLRDEVLKAAGGR